MSCVKTSHGMCFRKIVIMDLSSHEEFCCSATKIISPLSKCQWASKFAWFYTWQGGDLL